MNPQDKKKADKIVDKIVKLRLEMDKNSRKKLEGWRELDAELEDKIIELQDEFYDIPNSDKYRHNRPKKVSLEFATEYMDEEVIPWIEIGDKEDFITNLTPEIVQLILNTFYNKGDIIRGDLSIMNIYLYDDWEGSGITDTEARDEIIDMIMTYMRDYDLVIELDIYDLDDILSKSFEELAEDIKKYTYKKYRKLGPIRFDYINYLKEANLLTKNTLSILDNDLKNANVTEKMFKKILENADIDSENKFRNSYHIEYF